MWGHNNPVLHEICSREWREVRQLFGNWNVNLIAQTRSIMDNLGVLIPRTHVCVKKYKTFVGQSRVKLDRMMGELGCHGFATSIVQ